MKFYLRLFLLCCFGTNILNVVAQTSSFKIQVSQKFSEERRTIQNNSLDFYEDTSDTLSFQSISNSKFKGFVKYDALSKPLKSNTDYWVKFEMQNLEQFDTQYILFLGYVSDAKIYVLYPDSTFQQQTAGFFVPNEKLSPNEGIEVKTSITLKAQARHQIYIKYESSLPYPPELNLEVQSQNAWQKQMNQTDLIQGFFQGLLWMILLYNLFLFLALWDLTYFYYVLYVFFVSVYFLNEYEYVEEYFLTNKPKISFYILSNLIYVALVFYVQFNRLFLKTKKYGLFDALAKFWLLVSILFMLAAVPLAYYFFNEYVLIRNYFHIFYMSMILIFILFALFINNSVALFFVLGNLCILGGGIFIIMGNLGYVPFSLYYLLGGVAAELFVFTLALSYRYSAELYAKQSTQNKLIAQLKENENLQTKVNRELEQKVQERTQEIAYQNGLLAESQSEIHKRNLALQQQSDELEEAYNKMTDSVRYAKRLQSSILGDEAQLTNLFTESFMYFQPKDVVSGDFYWTSHVNHLKVIVCADCTGHGIPGALLTMLGSSILNDVVNEERVLSPEQILYELDAKLIETINKQTSGKKPQDGMDMIVLVFDEINQTVKFAGAMNALYYVRDYELHQIKASPFPIGITPNKKVKTFELHELAYKEEDIFYLSTDGFQDQFGGEEGSKYLKKRFREFLLKISHLPMQEQRNKIISEFETWKGSRNQTDDVLIMAIKV